MFSCLKAAALSSCLIAMTAVSPSVSNASTLNIYENGPAPGLDIDVILAIAGNVATFTFINNSTGGAAGSRVHEVYFESGLDSFLVSGSAVANATGTSAGVDLDPGAAPPNPPGGNNLTPDWSTVFSSFDEGNGATGITAGKQWVVTFLLDNAATTEAQLAAAIINQGGTSRIAMHIGDCSGQQSCAATVTGELTPGTQISEVPIPGAFVLMGTVLAGGGAFGAWRRRRERKA